MLLTTPPASAKARAFQSLLRRRALQALLAVLIFLHFTAFLPERTSTLNFAQSVPSLTANPSSLPEAWQGVQRVFIVSLLKDNEAILKAGWSDAVVNLTRTLGPENVWVSIHESGSRDDTKNELRSLELRLRELHAGHKINMADVAEDMHDMMPKIGPGWLNVKGERVMRRIPWLAELRNLNIEPLKELTAKKVVFDKILFLNDIIFTSDDALELLHTRRGDYAAACGFDYSRPWPGVAFYDQFATRDLDGQELAALYHPYFAPGESRDALRKGLPVPVKSCWSGIAAFDAAPFQDLKQPLRFRAVDDSLAECYLEASECCLIHYDNPLSASKGVWMNPNVRVAYDNMRYGAVHQPSGWPSTAATILGRLSDVLTWIVPLAKRRRIVDLRYEEWRQKSPLNTEAGVDCLVNKLMVVSEKGNWCEVQEA